MGNQERAGEHDAARLVVLAQVDHLAKQMLSQIHAALGRGSIQEGEEVGVLVSSLTRAIDRIADLPDDRDLSEDEITTLHAALLQQTAAGLALLQFLPLKDLPVMVAGFDLSRPT